jgi:hypothetical protein
VSVSVELLSTVTAAGSFAVAGLALLYSRRESASKASDARITQLAQEAQTAVKETQSSHSSRLIQLQDAVGRVEVVQKDIGDQVRTIVSKMVELDTKTGIAWQGYEQLVLGMAKNMAQIMHQPDKAREPYDKLLEGFMEGALTNDEYISLKKFLVDIKNWIPGKDLGYPVQSWEPTAAGTFLSIIDLVEPARMAAVGHAMHRTREEG